MTKKNARKTAARERQAKVGGKYTTHLEPKEDVLKLILAVCDEGMDSLHSKREVLEIIRGVALGKEPDWYQVPLTEREKADHDVQVQREMHAQGVTSDNELRGPLGDELRRERQPMVDELVRQGHMADKRVDEAFLILNSGIHFKGKLAPTREALLARIQQALQVLSPQRAVLEQAGDELMAEKMDEMFGPAPVENVSGRLSIDVICTHFKLKTQDVRARLGDGPWDFHDENFRAGLSELRQDANLDKRSETNRDMLTVNDAVFNDTVREVIRTPRVSERQTILNFLRWLRTSGPDAKTHDLVEAYCDAEARVEEYVKGGTARKWRVDNMGHAIAKDVKRILPSVEVGRIPYNEDQKWGAYFSVNGRAIEMTVTQNLISLSTGSDDKAAGYHDQVSATQAIFRHLNSNDKGEAYFPPISTADVFRSQYPGQPLPKGMLDPVTTGATPEQIMAYWKDLPAKKCADAKNLRMGVTDDHPEKPLVSWTSLARSKDCPGFTEWWNALPEAVPYHR